MLNLADKGLKNEPENHGPTVEAVDETEIEGVKGPDNEQIIADWRKENRNYYIALQILCVFFGAALIKFFEYLFR